MNNNSQEKRHWGIIGGGMLGLTLALRLNQAGHRVTVLETAETLGGLASAWQLGDVVWDRYYHVIMLSDKNLRSLLQELELESEIQWKITKTNFFAGAEIFPLNNAFDYIRLPALGLVDKLRLAATIVYGSRIENGKRLEHYSAEEWLTRLSGKRTYQNLWRPLLRAKLGSNYSQASAAYIWSVIRRFYAARRGGMKTEMFGYVPGGYAKIVDTLANKLNRSGVTLNTGIAVRSITRREGRLLVESDTRAFEFDRVINTCAAPIAARISAGLGNEEIKKLNGILYQGIICASLLLTRPLGGAYLTYITDETIPFTTIIEMSSLVDRASLAGNHLVYLPKYLPIDDPLFEKTDQQIEELFIGGLIRMFPDLSIDEIKAFRISRTRHVLAIATRNYSNNLPPMASSIPGLFNISSAQIVNASLSVDETVNLANTGAEYVTAHERTVR